MSDMILLEDCLHLIRMVRGLEALEVNGSRIGSIGSIGSRQPDLYKTSAMESVSEWPDLIPDLLLQISSKLTILEDFMALRGVCRSWRSCVTRDKFSCVSKIPLLMYEEGQEHAFYSLCKNKVCMRMAFLKARGKRCLDEGFGWILIAPPKNSHGDLSLVRLRPMNSSHTRIIQLPDTTKLHICKDDDCIHQAVLSANPSETSDFILMVSSDTRVAFCRHYIWMAGINLEGPGICYYYKQKFYAIVNYGCRFEMWAWGRPPAMDIFYTGTFLNAGSSKTGMVSYLVESSKGELLVLMQETDFGGHPVFQIRRIDIVKKQMTHVVKSLDGEAIFVGRKSAVSVAAHDFPGLIKPNRIYFTNHCTKLRPPFDTGMFNVEDGGIETLDVKPSRFVCPPIWIFPS